MNEWVGLEQKKNMRERGGEDPYLFIVFAFEFCLFMSSLILNFMCTCVFKIIFEPKFIVVIVVYIGRQTCMFLLFITAMQKPKKNKEDIINSADLKACNIWQKNKGGKGNVCEFCTF